MSAIGPGDFVECVEQDTCFDRAVTVGAIYMVCEVVPSEGEAWPCSLHGDDCRADGLLLREAPLSPDWQWCAAAFRPIYRPKSSLIEQLKRPVSEPA